MMKKMITDLPPQPWTCKLNTKTNDTEVIDRDKKVVCTIPRSENSLITANFICYAYERLKELSNG